MSKVKVLDSSLANMIAAGEVIERPSSVIKELVENSIDAHAKKITVSIKDAGRTSIYVLDDGDGMEREDAILAFKRHATSKISSTFDLFRIKTLGFRGEALPSIASVSKMTLITSTGNGIGTKIFVEEGEMDISDSSLLKGTQIEVCELFYNTPARLKYLKKDYTENANSIEVMTRIALAHPEVSFKFIIDDRLQFQTSGRGNLLETIAQIYGFDVAKKMIPFTLTKNDYSVTGFLGEPELAKSSRYYMITLLNGRNVYMPRVQGAIHDSYHDFIPSSRFPFVVLCLDIDCALVDVNVHPSKREVRFSKEEELRLALLEAIPNALKERRAFANADLSRRIKQTTVEVKPEQISILDEIEEEPIVNKVEITTTLPRLDIPLTLKEETIEEVEELNVDTVKETKVEEEKPKKKTLKAIAQMHRTYIICEDDEGGFHIVDQHAAYERINYEKFQKLFTSELKVREPLIPQVINLSPSDMLLFTKEKQELLETIGLKFESFGYNAYKVVQVPHWLDEQDEKEYIDILLEQALHGDKIDVNKLRTHAIATISCKASIKANDYLDLREMQYVIDTLFECENPTCCPHGRPTIIAFSKYQLERLFKRTGV